MGKKILLADDNADALAAMAKVLAGYEIISAGDGNAALALAVSEKPDIMLLDIDMPGLNGIEVLKKQVKTPRKPVVIMITADGSTETVAKALAIGVFSYIIKPFEGAEILDQVEKAFAFLGTRGKA